MLVKNKVADNSAGRQEGRLLRIRSEGPIKAKCFHFRKQILAAKLRGKEEAQEGSACHECVHSELPQGLGEGDSASCREGDPIGMLLLDHGSRATARTAMRK